LRIISTVESQPATLSCDDHYELLIDGFVQVEQAGPDRNAVKDFSFLDRTFLVVGVARLPWIQFPESGTLAKPTTEILNGVARIEWGCVQMTDENVLGRMDRCGGWFQEGINQASNAYDAEAVHFVG
jgi:hypothetical protein